MEKKYYQLFTDHMILMGIGLGVLHWILEAFLHVFIFHDGTLIQQLFSPDRHELWMRLLVVVLIIIFAHYVQFIVSCLKKAKDATNTAYNKLNQIFNTSADGMRVIDKDFNMIMANKPFYQLTGLNKEKIIGKKCYEVFSGPSCHTDNCPMEKIIAGEERIECDEEKERKDHVTIPCLVTVTPLRNSTGELIGIVEDFKDISERKRAEKELAKYRIHLEELVEKRTEELSKTNEQLLKGVIERKRAEKELRKTNRLLESIFSNMHFLVAYLDEDFNFIRVNKAFSGYDEKGPEFFIGKNYFDLYPSKEDKLTFRKVMEEVKPYFAYDKPYSKNSEDQVTYWDWSLCPVIDLDKKSSGLIFCLINVTERKKAQDALRESEVKYSVLVERAYDGVFIVSDEICSFVNNAFSEITGYSAAEITGKPFHDLVAPEYKNEVMEKYEFNLAGTKAPHFYETKIICKDRQIKDVEISVGFIQYKGKPAAIKIMRDITGRKKVEKELQKTQKLESLGVLAGGIAHDFNNLLTAIIGNLSLLELSTEIRENEFSILKEADEAAQRAKLLTQRLLIFAKGGQPIKKNLSISNILKDSINFALSGSNVKCNLSLPNDLWPAEVDEGQIIQVLNNLIINAGQAMAGGGIIEVSAENILVTDKSDDLDLKEGKYIKTSIKDHGIGIVKEHLSKIFDPYFTTKDKGSGLGLSISYGIILKHNGQLKVESSVGEGTTFFIYLPALNKGIAVERIVNEDYSKGKGRILFMDDQQIIRKMAGRILTRIGYRVELTKDGKEAIDQYKKAQELGDPFDVVILDLTVPGGIGGKEAIKRMKEIDSEIKAIVSSGYSNDPIMSNFKQYGFSGVVAKPYDINELSSILNDLIKGTRESCVKV